MNFPPPLSAQPQLTFYAVPGVPEILPGDDLAEVLAEALSRAACTLQECDVLCVTSKLLSRAEGRFVPLASVVPSPEALQLAQHTQKDARLVELVLRESSQISKAAPGVLIVRHRLGFLCANAGIDASNAQTRQGATDAIVLLLPVDPDGSAAALQAKLSAASGAHIAVVITDSHGRAFREGTVGVAIGCAGIAPLYDQRGRGDRHGRLLEHTVTATADQLAAAADLIAGQADEGRPLILVRGLSFRQSRTPANALYRPANRDLYANAADCAVVAAPAGDADTLDPPSTTQADTSDR